MLLKLIIICTFGFLAAGVDAIAGGGGLISLPALLLIGVPPQFALGTNKFSASTASFSSSLTFARSGKVHFPIIKWQIPFTFVGALTGVWAVLHVPSAFLNKAVPIMILFVGIYTVLHKDLGIEDKFQGLKPANIAIGCLFALALGFYDGFFGPGTGSFLIFAFITVYGFDFVTASANSKLLNFTSNFASLLLFIWNRKILYMYGIPMALFMIAGSFVGSRLAIQKGAQLVKPIFLIMSVLVAVKMIYSL